MCCQRAGQEDSPIRSDIAHFGVNKKWGRRSAWASVLLNSLLVTAWGTHIKFPWACEESTISGWWLSPYQAWESKACTVCLNQVVRPIRVCTALASSLKHHHFHLTQSPFLVVSHASHRIGLSWSSLFQCAQTLWGKLSSSTCSDSSNGCCCWSP